MRDFKKSMTDLRRDSGTFPFSFKTIILIQFKSNLSITVKINLK